MLVAVVLVFTPSGLWPLAGLPFLLRLAAEASVPRTYRQNVAAILGGLHGMDGAKATRTDCLSRSGR